MDAAQNLDAKVVVIGNSGVGKTCIVLRYVQNRFVPHTASTIGASFVMKKLHVDDVKITLQIWDTAGQERFKSMAPMYYRGAVAAILAFDITSEASFNALELWYEELRKEIPGDIALAVACNKADLGAKRSVPMKRAEEYAASIGAKVYKTSAKDNEGIEEMFIDIARQVTDRMKKAKANAGRAGRTVSDAVDVNASTTAAKGCSC